MPKLLIHAAFCLTLIAAGPPSKAPAQLAEPAGDYGDPRRLLIEGTETFSPSEVKAALLQDYDLLMAAHPSAPLGQYVDVLRQKLAAGYRHGGFPEVEVRLRVNRDLVRLEAAVEEGPRYTAGEVRVSGAETIDAAGLTKRLTEPFPPPDAMPAVAGAPHQQAAAPWVDQYGKKVERKEPLWKPGKPAPFDRPTRNKMRRRLERAFADQGRFSAKFDLDVVAQSDQNSADLVVTITEEGPQAVVGRIDIRGNKSNSRQQVLGYLELEPGRPLTDHTCSRLRDRLWRSGRFLSCRVKPIEPADGGREVALDIELTEYAKAPPLRQELSPAEKVALRLRDWLADPDRWQADLVIRGRPFGPGMSGVFSPGSGSLFQFGLPEDADEQTPAKLTFVASTQHVGLYLPPCGRKLTGRPQGAAVLANVALAAAEKPEDLQRPFQLRFGIGVHVPPPGEVIEPFRLTMQLDPSAFLGIIHQGNAQCRLQDGVLSVSNPRGERWRVDAQSGRLLEYTWDEEVGGPSLKICFVPGELKRRLARIEKQTAEYPDAFDPQRPLSSLLEVLCHQQLISAFAQLKPRQRRTLETVRGMIGRGVLEPVDRLILTSNAGGDGDFKIPFQPPKPGDPSAVNPLAMILRLALPQYGRLFPHDSWPWTLGREAAFVATGSSKYTDAELQKLYTSDENGPLCFLATGCLLELLNPRLARPFAAKGLEKLSVDDFRKDYHILIHGDGIAGECIRRAAEILRDLDRPQVELLTKAFPGEHGRLLGRAAEVLRRHRDRPIAEALPEVLDDLWQRGLYRTVRTALADLQQRTSPEATKVTQVSR